MAWLLCVVLPAWRSVAVHQRELRARVGVVLQGHWRKVRVCFKPLSKSSHVCTRE